MSNEKVKLVITDNQKRLHIGSYFVDLNNSEYMKLVEIFSDQQTLQLQSRIKELEDALFQLNKPTDCGMYESDMTNCNCKHCGVHISSHK